MLKRKQGLQMGAVPLKTSLRETWQYTESPVIKDSFNHHCREPPDAEINKRFKSCSFKNIK
jgi:hypothetical protein